MLERTSRLTLPCLLPGLLLAVAATAWPPPAQAAVGRWSSLLDGGPVWALAAHPTRRGWLFAGTKTNGVLRSVDGGATWQPPRRGVDNAWVRAFAFDPADAGVIFVGLQDGGLFKSTDGGNSWFPSTGGQSFHSVQSLAFDPHRRRTLYAASTSGDASGVFRSTDGGASWHARNAGLPAGGVDALALSPTTPGLLWAGTFGGVYRSTDGGASWTPAGLASSNVAALALAPRSGALWAAADDGLFESTDGGRSWVSRLGAAVASVAVDPGAPEDIYAGGAELWRSTDSGATWRRADADLQGFSVMAIAPVPGIRGAVVAGAADPIGFTGALFRSSDRGASWAVGGRGLVDREILSFAVDPAAPSTLYASDANQGVFKSADGGLHWAALTIPPLSPESGEAEIAIDPMHSSTLYLVNSGDFVSTDGGSTWEPLGALPPFTATQLTLLAIDPRDSNVLYGAANATLFKSQDGGLSWTVILRADPLDLFFDIVVDPAAPSTLYAAGAHFDVESDVNGAALLKSTDGGGTWTSIVQGLPAGVIRLAVEPTGARLYAGTGGGLFASGDGGDSWERLAGITTEPVAAVAAPASAQVYVVQAAAGVHWSGDGGASWVALNRGLDNFLGFLLEVAEASSPMPAPPLRRAKPSPPAGTTLYLGLVGGGLQSYTVP